MYFYKEKKPSSTKTISLKIAVRGAKAINLLYILVVSRGFIQKYLNNIHVIMRSDMIILLETLL